jgi:hypothetical protein
MAEVAWSSHLQWRPLGRAAPPPRLRPDGGRAATKGPGGRAGVELAAAGVVHAGANGVALAGE